jgi:membrane protein YqaA with SNARE-associated domain
LSVYIAIFAAAFLAATIVPFYSEVAVGAAVLAGQSPAAVWLAASLGNTAGAVVNGLLGRFLGYAHVERLLMLDAEQFARVRAWYQRWGIWSLLLAWLPIGGDALTVVAGVMRARWPAFILLVFTGKAARYAVLIYAVLLGMQAGR